MTSRSKAQLSMLVGAEKPSLHLNIKSESNSCADIAKGKRGKHDVIGNVCARGLILHRFCTEMIAGRRERVKDLPSRILHCQNPREKVATCHL